MVNIDEPGVDGTRSYFFKRFLDSSGISQAFYNEEIGSFY